LFQLTEAPFVRIGKGVDNFRLKNFVDTLSMLNALNFLMRDQEVFVDQLIVKT
jgi:hypothetical protein